MSPRGLPRRSLHVPGEAVFEKGEWIRRDLVLRIAANLGRRFAEQFEQLLPILFRHTQEVRDHERGQGVRIVRYELDRDPGR